MVVQFPPHQGLVVVAFGAHYIAMSLLDIHRKYRIYTEIFQLPLQVIASSLDERAVSLWESDFDLFVKIIHNPDQEILYRGCEDLVIIEVRTCNIGCSDIHLWEENSDAIVLLFPDIGIVSLLFADGDLNDLRLLELTKNSVHFPFPF